MMDLTTILLLVIFAFGASFVQRVTGFGFGIFIMTILPHLLPSYAEATALSGLLALISALISSAQMLRYFDWRKMWLIMTVFLFVSFFSVKTVSLIDSSTLRRILGVFLILVSLYFFVFSGKIRIRPSVTAQLGMGTISGLMGGFFAMQGPPAVIYFLSCADSKEQYMSLVSVYFVIGNAVMTLFRAGNGFVTPIVVRSWLICLPAVLVGILVGAKVYRKIPVTVLKKVVYGYMAFAGVLALKF